MIIFLDNSNTTNMRFEPRTTYNRQYSTKKQDKILLLLSSFIFCLYIYISFTKLDHKAIGTITRVSDTLRENKMGNWKMCEINYSYLSEFDGKEHYCGETLRCNMNIDLIGKQIHRYYDEKHRCYRVSITNGIINTFGVINLIFMGLLYIVVYVL